MGDESYLFLFRPGVVFSYGMDRGFISFAPGTTGGTIAAYWL